MKEDPNELKVGDRVGNAEVIALNAFGPLPRGRIVKGPNTGVEIYLHIYPTWARQT